MLRWLALVTLLPVGLLRAADDPVAVFAQVSNGYTRTRLPDKSFKPEAYTFGEGGCLSGSVKDSAIDGMTFLKVAQAVAVPLARLNYHPARTAAEAELLILVYWGSTQGSQGHDPGNTMDRLSNADSDYAAGRAAAAVAGTEPLRANSGTTAAEAEYDNALWQLTLGNHERDQLDDRNARILGYTDVLDRARFASHMGFAQDVKAEVADSRYYVVLQAYDFKTAAKEKKLKPLWTARISMSTSGNNFAQSLDQMLRYGAHYFGQDSNGLHRDANREGHVEIGPLNVVEPSPTQPAK